MSKFYHCPMPQEEDFQTEEDFLDAMETWESDETEWEDEYIERRRMED